jgi:hypothetical protein
LSISIIVRFLRVPDRREVFLGEALLVDEWRVDCFDCFDDGWLGRCDSGLFGGCARLRR